MSSRKCNPDCECGLHKDRRCKPGCSCGRHRSKPCPNDCTCKKHDREALTEIHRKRIGRGNKGKVRTLEMRIAASERALVPETNRLIRDAAKNRPPVSEKTRLLQEESQARRFLKQDERDKLKQAHIGKTLSEIHKKNISSGLLKAWRDHPEYFENSISDGHGGSFFSKKMRKTLYFRSSWEGKLYRDFDDLEDLICFFVEPFGIEYIFKGVNHVYVPDVLTVWNNGAVILIEVKPRFRTNHPINQAKFWAARKFCRRLGWKFQVWTEDEIFVDENNRKIS